MTLVELKISESIARAFFALTSVVYRVGILAIGALIFNNRYSFKCHFLRVCAFIFLLAFVFGEISEGVRSARSAISLLIEKIETAELTGEVFDENAVNTDPLFVGTIALGGALIF